jgi:hypothetical protein
MLLMVMALMAAEIAGSGHGPVGRLTGRMRWLGPAILGVAQAAATAWTLWKAGEIVKTW